MELKNDDRPKQKHKVKFKKRDKPLKRMAWLEALFDGLPEAIVLIDRAGRLVYCNPAATYILGQELEAVEPEAWAQQYGFYLEDGKTFYPGQDLPLVRALKGENVEYEEMILRPSNEEPSRWVNMAAKPLSQTVEGIEGVMVMMRDISVRKQMERSRENYNRQVEALYAFSHELAEIGLDLNLILTTMAAHVARGIGDACVITLWKDGKLKNVAADHPNPEAGQLLREIAFREEIEETFVREVMDSGAPVFIPTLPSEAIDMLNTSAYAEFIQKHGIQSIMIVPLKGRHGVAGTVSLSRDAGRPAYTPEDQSFGVDIAYRASLAIENSRLFESLLEEMEERVSAKKAQEESEERLRSIFESTALGIKVLNLDGKIVQINPALQQMLGYSASEVLGRHFTELLHPRDIGRGNINFEAIRHGLRDLRFEHRLYDKDGRIVWVNTTLTGVRANPGDEHLAFVVGMVENITDRKKIQFELREMKVRLLQGIEKERLRLAQDLHDGPMQDLHSATYLLASMDVAPPFQEKIESVSQIIQEVIYDLRAVAQELRPPAITDFGLEKAIRSHVEDLSVRYPAIKFQSHLDQEELTEEIRLAFFRVYQTLVANVIRHAAASEVSVRLSLDAEEVRLEIADNGKGFIVPPRWIMLIRKGHLGLAGAAERIEALGGTFEVESLLEKGTRVLVRLPSPAAQTEAQTMDEEKDLTNV